MENLKGLKVAILVTDGFEQVELLEPRKALDQAGAETRVVSSKDQRVKGWKFTDWGEVIPVDVPLDVAAICHGPWTVIEAGAAKGRRIASWPSLKTDLRNAGAEWMDQEVVVDRNLVSSRKPDDIPAFNREMIKLFGQAATASEHSRQTHA
jgi:protease I